jgi:RNA polymerase sigma-70 factor (sigma-E family)
VTDILDYPQSFNGFWGGVTECGLGSIRIRSARNRLQGGSASRRESGTGSGGEPVVNMMVSSQPIDTVLDDVETVLEDAVLGITDPGPGGPVTSLGIDGTTKAGTEILVSGELAAAAARPMNVTDSIAVSAFLPEARPAASTAAWDAHQVVTEIYQTEYKSLVRLAMLLVHDVPTAEEVVQDSFVAMHHAWRRLRDSQKALSYLRQAVVNRSRSVLRHRTVVDKNAPKPAPDEPSAESGAIAAIERDQVVAALRTLPVRQREALVLRYYGDFSEAEIATAMGISRGAVKSHTARGMSALKSILEQETS